MVVSVSINSHLFRNNNMEQEKELKAEVQEMLRSPQEVATVHVYTVHY